MGKIVDVSEALLELGLSDSATDEERALINSAITKAEGAVRRHLHYDPVQRSRTEFYPQTDRDLLNRAAVFEVEGSQAVLRKLASAATEELQVQHIPIRSITTLSIDLNGRSGTTQDAFPATSLKTEGTDFWPNYDGFDGADTPAQICRDGILRSFGRWPNTPGTVKIVYVAGYTSAELHGQNDVVDASPIVDAVIDEVVRRARKAFVNFKKTGAGFVAGPFSSEKLGDYSYNIDTSVLNRLFGGVWDLLPETQAKLSEFVNYGWSISS